MATKRNTLQDFGNVISHLANNAANRLDKMAKTPSGTAPEDASDEILTAIKGSITNIDLTLSNLVQDVMAITSAVIGKRIKDGQSYSSMMSNTGYDRTSLPNKIINEFTKTISNSTSKVISASESYLKDISVGMEMLIDHIASMPAVTTVVTQQPADSKNVPDSQGTQVQSKAVLELIVQGITRDSVDSLITLAAYDFSKSNLGAFDLDKFVYGMNNLYKLKKLQGLDFSFITKDYVDNFSHFFDLVHLINERSTELYLASDAFGIKILDIVPFIESISTITNALKEPDLSEFGDAVENLNYINYKLKELNFDLDAQEKVRESLAITSEAVNCMTELAKNLETSSESLVFIDVFLSMFDSAAEAISSAVSAINKNLTNTVQYDSTIFDALNSYFDAVNALSKKVTKFGAIYLLAIVSAPLAKGAIESIISALEPLDKKMDTRKLQTYIKYAADIEALFSALISALRAYRIASMMADGSNERVTSTLATVVSSFGSVISKINDSWATEDTKQAFENIKNFSILMVAITGVMALGIAAGALIIAGIAPLLAFGVMLNLFIVTTITSVNAATTNIGDAFLNIDAFGKFLIDATKVIVYGTFVGMLVAAAWPMLFGFTIALSGFIMATLRAVSVGGQDIGDANKNLDQFANLLVKATAVLIIGSLAAPAALGAILFTGLLGGFLYGMSKVTKGIDITAKEIDMKQVEELAEFTAIMGGILVLGAAFMFIPNMLANAMLFTVALSAFVGGVTLAYAYAAKLGKGSLKFATEFAVLVGVTGALLVAAAYIMEKNPDLYAHVLYFGAALATLIFTVTLAYSAAGKKINRSLSAALGLSYVIAATGATLMLASYIWKSVNYDDVLGFIGAMSLTVALMGVICTGLYESRKQILKGAGIMLAIDALVVLGGIVLIAMSKSIEMAGGYENILIALGMFAITVIAIGGICALLGGLATFIVPGIIVLALIEVLIYGFTLCVEKMADSMLKMKELEDIDNEKIQNAIAGYFSIFDKADIGPVKLAKIALAAMAAGAIGSAISSIATGVHAMASLQVPEYDENGHATGKMIALNENDFEHAATNTSKIISVLGGAIEDAYKAHPSWFQDNSVAGLLGLSSGRNTKFGLMVSASAAMGSMIASIAEGVATMARLRVPVYADGKRVGYRTLNANDFTNAATNISTIITTLGNAIVNTYDEHADWFEDKSLLGYIGFSRGGNTRFGRTVSALSGMSNLISDISKAVASVATLQVPEYDANGRPTGKMIQLDKSHFTKAGENVSEIVTVLGNALIATAESHPEFFEDKSLLGYIGFSRGGNTLFGKIISAMTGLGSLVKDSAEAVAYVSTLKINGKPFNEQSVKPIAKTVELILTTIGKAMGDTYKHNKKIFDDPTWLGKFGISLDSNSPFGKIKNALEGSGKMITDAAEAIKIANDVYAEVDINTTRRRVYNIMSTMPLVISEIQRRYYNKNDISRAIDKIVKNQDKYKTLFRTYKTIFTEANSMLAAIGAANGDASATIDSVINSVKAMTDSIGQMNEAIIAAASVTSRKQVGFVDRVKNGIKTFMFGSDETANPIETLIESFDRLQKTAASTAEQSIKKVGDSAENIQTYVKAINSLDVEKATTMSDMFATMAKFNSDNANSMIRVVNKLVVEFNNILGAFRQELNDTRNIINSADSIQRRREDAINKAIERVNKLMKDPIIVKVTEEQEQNPQGDQSMMDNAKGKISDFINMLRGDGAQHAPQSTAPVASPSTSSDSSTPQSSPETAVSNSNPYVSPAPWHTSGQLSFNAQMDIDGEAQRGNTGRTLK